MDKLLSIIDSCTNMDQMELFYNNYLMKVAHEEHQIWMLKGAYRLKLLQMKSTIEATYKRERFPCTDEQPLQTITDGPY